MLRLCRLIDISCHVHGSKSAYSRFQVSGKERKEFFFNRTYIPFFLKMGKTNNNNSCIKTGLLKFVQIYFTRNLFLIFCSFYLFGFQSDLNKKTLLQKKAL